VAHSVRREASAVRTEIAAPPTSRHSTQASQTRRASSSSSMSSATRRVSRAVTAPSSAMTTPRAPAVRRTPAHGPRALADVVGTRRGPGRTPTVPRRYRSAACLPITARSGRATAGGLAQADQDLGGQVLDVQGGP
jgi:hypothetical protein